ncbi:MAG: cobyrinic acid a,c-diamide synthase, partial [Clostridiaceae bacterium]
TNTLNNFGYNSIEVSSNALVKKDLKINSHEFHKSKVVCSEKTVYKLRKVGYTGEIKEWTCGYVKNNALGAYGHIHFFSNLDFIREIIKSCKKRNLEG